MAGDIASYIFGGTSGTPSYDELLRRRQIATANAMRQKKMPTTLGEGMTYLGEAVGDRLESNRLTEAERAFATSEDARLAAARAGAAGGGALPTRAGVAPAAAAPAGATRVPTERIAPAAVPTGAIPGARADINPRDKLAALLNPDDPAVAPQEVASLDPTQGAAKEPPLDFLAPGSQSEVEGWKRAIGGIESSHDYRAIGVPTKHGRAMGYYGVMEENIPKWTAQALGQSLTPQQFLADSDAQDAVFKHKFGQYVAKYGPEKAARAWYGGEGNINNLNATDAHEKLSVYDYGRDFINRLRGRRSDAEGDPSTAPVQLAALGGPSGTMTDAPPIGMGNAPIVPKQPLQDQPAEPWPANPAPAPNWRPRPIEPMRGPGSEAEEPDPTVVGDIKPMSVAPNQFAQVGPEMFSPRPMMSDATAMGPNPVPLPAAPRAPARPPAAPADLPPSLTPVPPASKQVMADPGPAPKPPERFDELPGQRQWMDVINNRNSSPYAKEYAQNEFNRLEKRRTEINTLRESDYRDTRERWQVLRDAKDKFDREADNRDIDQLTKRLGIEQAQVKLEEDYYAKGIPRTQARDKAKNEINESLQRQEKAAYEITQRAVEERAKLASTQKTEQEVAANETREIGGVIYQRTKAAPGTPAGPWEVAPGSPKKEEKITEVQGKTIKFLQRATVASSQLGDASVLAGLKDTAAGKVPIGGNYAVSPEYQRARSAAFTWGQAVLRDESGAVLGAGEIANKLSAYFPEPGDSEQVIRDKAFRRKAEEDSLYHSLGEAKPQIDRWREERKTRKAIDPATSAPYPEGTTRINNRTGVKQRVMGGHWESEEDLK